MWKAIGVTLAVLVAILLLTRMQGGKAGLDPRDQLAFERQRSSMRRQLGTDPSVTPPALACVADRATPATVETLYRVWINRRPDTATAPDRDAAEAELARLIAACGADFTATETAAHQRGLDLADATARAMLAKGR